MDKDLKLLFIFVIYLALPQYSIAQDFNAIDIVNLEFIYNYKIQEDSTSKNSIKELPTVLQKGAHHSRFTTENIPIQDSILLANENADPNTTVSKLMPYIASQTKTILTSYSIYKNYPNKGEMEFTSYLDRSSMLIVKQKMDMKWNIIPKEDSLILGLKCLKATTRFAGRNYCAWFAPEIPINDGPYKFHGLPGLIIRIADTQNQHIFELIEIRNLSFKRAMLYSNNSWQKATPKTYLKALEQEVNRRYEWFQNINGVTDENRAKMLHKTKQKNNFIERY